MLRPNPAMLPEHREARCSIRAHEHPSRSGAPPAAAPLPLRHPSCSPAPCGIQCVWALTCVAASPGLLAELPAVKRR